METSNAWNQFLISSQEQVYRALNELDDQRTKDERRPVDRVFSGQWGDGQVLTRITERVFNHQGEF